MFQIEFTSDAVDELRTFRKSEQRTIFDQIGEQLSYEPEVDTRNRKKLRPNDVAKYELRIGKYRVFYDVDEQAQTVKIEAIGYKEGNRLFIRGKEYAL
jgi:mRNA-degrading endonuclease RelE of RelBE toxin-antitoxin system